MRTVAILLPVLLTGCFISRHHSRGEDPQKRKDVFANNRGVAHKGSSGMSPIFPDVCKTPTPGGPVPIPYPNVGKTSDETKGSKKVKVDGKPVIPRGHRCVKSCDHAEVGGRWTTISKNHKHGPSCGHYWIGSKWVATRRVNVARNHKCNARCNHYAYKNSWFSIPNHVHKTGCGHTMRGGKWVAR